MNSYVIYLAPTLGILGLLVMAFKSAWVGKQDAGDANMQELAGHIADGAMAFLKAEWKVLSIFVMFTAALLAYSGTIHTVNGKEIHSSWLISVAFIVGAVCSATAGFIGMKVATKANDVGADLVGKVEAGIPEDDVRNPATIADNVGDNVGDVAGMGADLFGSYVATILATMVLGQEIKVSDALGGMSPILLPMVICGLGLVFSLIATFLV